MASQALNISTTSGSGLRGRISAPRLFIDKSVVFGIIKPKNSSGVLIWSPIVNRLFVKPQTPTGKMSTIHGHDQWLADYKRNKVSSIDHRLQVGINLLFGIAVFLFLLFSKPFRLAWWQHLDFKRGFETVIGFLILVLVGVCFLCFLVMEKVPILAHWIDRKWAEILYYHWRDRNPVYLILITMFFGASAVTAVFFALKLAFTR